MQRSEAAGAAMLNAKMNGKKRKAGKLGGVKTTTKRNRRLGEDGVIRGPPCGACKYKRSKCTSTCTYAPYFSSDKGYDNFMAVHDVFGAARLAKLLSDTPPNRREEAVLAICFEAKFRLLDPVFGCVPRLLEIEQKLQQQAGELLKERERVQAQVMKARKKQQQRMEFFQQADLSAFAGNSNSAGGGMDMNLTNNSLSMDPAFARNSNSAGGCTNMNLPGNSYLSRDPSGFKDEMLSEPLPSLEMQYEMDPAIARNSNSAGGCMNMNFPSNSYLSMDPAFARNSNSAGGCMNMSRDPYGFKDKMLSDPLPLLGMQYEMDPVIARNSNLAGGCMNMNLSRNSYLSMDPYGFQDDSIARNNNSAGPALA